MSLRLKILTWIAYVSVIAVASHYIELLAYILTGAYVLVLAISAGERALAGTDYLALHAARDGEAP